MAWFLFSALVLTAQELYVFSEPASNMPARSMGFKYAGKWLKGDMSNRLEQRHGVEVQLGHRKNWMTHLASTFSDMYTSGMRWESVRMYSKYRVYSHDDVHKHFRAAVFGEMAYSVNRPMYDELNLEGDQSGMRGGFIVTQLLHKLAVSTTVSYTRSFQERIKHVNHRFNYNAFHYSLSAGYLLFPRKYQSYRQTNVNLYLEMMGSQSVDTRNAYLDMAPAIQLILNSTSKVNVGYRFQLNGNMRRMASNAFHVSFEHTLLNVLR
jgi:hypothetical protein